MESGGSNILLDNYIILFKTLIQKIIIILVSIFIVLNLIIRAFVPGEILYPSDAKRMPYVKHCKTKVKDDQHNYFCPNAKDIDSFDVANDNNNVFRYVETNGSTNIPYDDEVYSKPNEYIKLFQQNSMYLSAARFVNLGILNKSNFKFPFNPLFLSYPVTIRSQRSINKILAALHDTMFRSTTHFRVLFIILTMFVVVMMDNMAKTGGIYDTFNDILRIHLKIYPCLDYLLKLAYSTFGGFFVFFKLLGFLFIPFLLVIILEYISAKSTKRMLFQKYLLFL